MINKVLLILVIFVTAFAAWFMWAIFTDKPPTFFPLDNAQAEYRVSKKCVNGQGWEEEFSGEGNAYCIEYKGSGVFLHEEQNSSFFRITVGKTDIDLEPLVGKRVKNIKGHYTSSDKQCVKDKCTGISGPYIVLDIKSLELAE